MRTRHVIALVLGVILALPGLGVLIGGGTVGVLLLATRDSGGWYSMSVDRITSDGVAVTAQPLVIRDAAPPVITDWLDLDVRLSVQSLDAKPIFVGIADQAALGRYLGGAAHDVLVRVSRNGTPFYTAAPGTSVIGPPAGQAIWDVTASGAGQQQLTWTPRTGSWAAAIMNGDGSPGVSAAVTASVRSSAIGPIALALMGLGMILVATGTGLIVTALVRARPDRRTSPDASSPSGSTPATFAPAPDRPAGRAAYGLRLAGRSPSPVALEARLDPALSRGLWIVKWLLAIPHFLVLAVLWFALGLATIAAWFAILFTGRYPHPLFDFSVGVLRWTWRVAYYAGSGGLGSDRYPPFTLAPMPDDAAHLDVAYPGQLSRGLIFVKWLLLLPHWVVLAILTGPTVTWVATSGQHWETSVPGILGLITLVAALVLLLSGGYPKGLFDVIVGLNRWEYRVLAYALLMTDIYPPFRLDQGGSEVGSDPSPAGPPIDESVGRDSDRTVR